MTDVHHRRVLTTPSTDYAIKLSSPPLLSLCHSITPKYSTTVQTICSPFYLVHQPGSLSIMSDSLPRVCDEEAYLPHMAKKCCREVRDTYAWEGQKWSGFTVLMQNSDDILTSGFPLTQKLNSDLLGITSSVCMCESSIAEQEAGEKPWVYCCSFWNQWCFGKNPWTVCIPRDSMLHAQQGLLSTCLHTHLSQAGIGGRLSMLWEPNLPIPKHSMQFLEPSTW